MCNLPITSFNHIQCFYSGNKGSFDSCLNRNHLKSKTYSWFLQIPTASTQQNGLLKPPDASRERAFYFIVSQKQVGTNLLEEKSLLIMLNSASRLCVVKQPVRRHKRWPMISVVSAVCLVFAKACVWEHAWQAYRFPLANSQISTCQNLSSRWESSM